ncbi:MAG: PEP-CTERM sorting domain-containing protein [Bythopirellula sp.]
MNRISKSILTMAAVGLCCLANLPNAQADWSEDFNGSTLTNTWFFGSGDAGGAPSGTFLPADQGSNYPDAIVNSQLQMSDSRAVGAGGAAQGFGVVVVDPIADVLVTGTINPNGNAAVSDTAALIARGNLGTGQFYAAELSFEDGKLIIFRNNDFAGSANDLAEVTIPDLDNTDSVHLQLRLLGDTITARAFDVAGGSLLGAISVTDTDPAKISGAGPAGVLTFFAGDVGKPLLGQFDDLNATTIPEPTSAVLLTGALCAGLAARRRRAA